LPRMRWKVPQPLSARAGLVAVVIQGSPASSRSGPAALDSPENAGPTRPSRFLVSMAFLASAGAWDGSACESYSANVTVHFGLAALCSSTANLTLFLMFWPRLA
jgi:hypothetical protein